MLFKMSTKLKKVLYCKINTVFLNQVKTHNEPEIMQE